MAKTKQTKPRYTSQQRNQQHSEAVAAELVARLKEGTAPWQKPWDAGKTQPAPFNPTTGKPYRGGNALWLQMNQQTDDPRWMTYKQAQDQGWQVRKGEKGTTVEFWQFSKEVDLVDENGRPVYDPDGKIVKTTEELEFPIVRHSTAFNGAQIDSIPPWEPPKQTEQQKFERHAECERILSESGADIRHKTGDRAFYSPRQDFIQLPLREQFTSADAYYATALHELGHWTGHESRLDREILNTFGTEAYAREELRAEISSMMIGRELGVGHDPDQHAAYVGSWIKALEEDPREIFRAARDAERIKEFVMQPERQEEFSRAAQESQRIQRDREQTPSAAGSQAPHLERTYFNVDFAERGEAKKLGARWDRIEKSWYAADDETASALEQRWQRRDPVAEKGQPEKTAIAEKPADEKEATEKKVRRSPEPELG